MSYTVYIPCIVIPENSSLFPRVLYSNLSTVSLELIQVPGCTLTVPTLHR